MPGAVRVIDQAVEIVVDASGFSGNLSGSDTDAQTALDTVDGLSIGGAPGGSTTQVQYNNAGAFGGAAGFIYNLAASPNVTIQAQNAAYIPLLLKGAASQSANLLECHNSAGTPLSAFDSAGQLGVGITTGLAGLVHVSKNTNGLADLYISNTDGGTGARAALVVSNDLSTGNFVLATYGTGYTTSGAIVQDSALFMANIGLSGGMSFATREGSASMRFYTAGIATANERMRIDSAGDITFGDATDFIFDTSTGSEIGTATGQKIGFWGATPVVQQVLATGGAATVDNVISLLQTLGLCKQS